MSSDKDLENTRNFSIKEELVVTDPCAVPIIFHEKKGQILKLLIEKEMTIIDLKHATGMNPGTVKRHLNDLLEYNLIYISNEFKNEYSIVMKFYRATAKKYRFNLEWIP